MFQTGDRVMYGIHGVCRIVGSERQKVDKNEVTYLVLEPLTQPGSRYMVPTHNTVAMGKLQRILERDELEQLIHSDTVQTDCWIRDESQRKQLYRELIGSGDRVKLMAMLCTLYRHKAEQTAAGKKVHMCDDNFLRDAEKILISEISAVLEMDAEAAKQYIRSKLKRT